MSIPLREYCVGGCGNKLPGTPDHYEHHGNWCVHCTRRADQNSYYFKNKARKVTPPKQPSLERYAKMNDELYNKLKDTVEAELKTGYPPPAQYYVYKGRKYLNHNYTESQ